MWTFLKRVISGRRNELLRSGAVSFATVLIMTVTLVIIGSLIFLSAILTNTLSTIENKVDVNVYFVTNASETDILERESELEALPQVRRWPTPRATRRSRLQERHATDVLTLQALQELGDQSA
jgi:cell division protein FtsX